MAIPTKLKKVPKWAWIVGGVSAAGVTYYIYKKKKEGESTTTATPGGEGELSNQYFIPVTGGAGAGAVAPPSNTGGGENVAALLGLLSEQNKGQQEANRENARLTEESNRNNAAANEKMRENEETRNTNILKAITEATAARQKQHEEEVKGTTGGGAPGPETHTGNGATVQPVVVNVVSQAKEATKSLFGGRTIVHPNEPGSYIVAANGAHCPNTEYNRGHPKTMRGCQSA